MTSKFNRDDVLTTLASIVDKYGAEHVYEHAMSTCRYSNADGTPSCIVGHIIYWLEPEVFERIHEYEWRNGSDDGPESCAVRYLGENGLELDYENESEAEFLVEALTQGQRAQDFGKTWGEAEDAIRATLGEGSRHGKA